MSCIINASVNGLEQTSDTSGIFVLQTDGVTRAQIDSNGLTVPGTLKASGMLAQSVSVVNTASQSTTALIPGSDVIPTNTAGAQFLSASITPKNVNSLLEVTITLSSCYCSVVAWFVAALFRDSGVNAVSSTTWYESVAGAASCINFSYVVTAGSLAATTFSVRAGLANAGTFTLNYLHAGSAASRITIKEYLP